jgi:hypothetical protein
LVNFFFSFLILCCSQWRFGDKKIRKF